MEITISIIVPAYKTPERYLVKCINSIENQTFNKYEVILIDDNEKKDKCGQLCDILSTKFNNIICLHQKNQGVSVARNNGLLHAKGKWIAFVDPDDWLEPNYLERLWAEGEKRNVDIVMCSCYANYKNRENKNEFFKCKEKIFKGISKDEVELQLICRGANKYFPPESGAGVPWAKLYRKDFLEEKHLLFNPKLIRMQDNIFNLYAIEEAKEIYFFNEFLYHYRKNNGSATGKYNPNVVTYLERVNVETENFIRTFNKGEEFYKALYAKILTGCNGYFTLYYWPALYNKKKNYVYLRREIKALLSKPIYKTALKNVDLRYLTFKEKIYVFFLKKKYVSVLLILTYLKNVYKTIRHGLPENTLNK